MKRIAVLFLVLCSAALAQTPHKSTTAAHSPSESHAAARSTLPHGISPVRGIVHTAFSLRYQEIKLGTGPLAEPNKMYKVLYTGYLAATGQIFDSSEEHRQPLRDKDGKIITGDDGKPKLGDPQPISFPQGFGRVIPGFDQGFAGMHVNGKRRIFVPWQLAYGTRDIPSRGPEHPGIPPKSDLIFDVELVSMSDIEMPQGHPPMGAMPGHMPHPGAPLPPGHPSVPPTPTLPSAEPHTSAPATAQPDAKPAAPTTSTPPAEPKTPPQPQK